MPDQDDRDDPLERAAQNLHDAEGEPHWPLARLFFLALLAPFARRLRRRLERGRRS